MTTITGKMGENEHEQELRIEIIDTFVHTHAGVLKILTV